MLLFTEAPVEYDYGYTNEIVRLIFDRRHPKQGQQPRVLRVVDVVPSQAGTMEDLHFTCQRDRYRSGMYFTTDCPDDVGVFLQLEGGPGAAALLRGYAGVARLCDECGDTLHPTFDPPGGTCGSCREASDRSLREWKDRHAPKCHICGERYGDGTLCACEREARADAAQ